MKSRFFSFAVLIVIFGLVLSSCASSPRIEPESLIGTRWIDSSGSANGIMFIDIEHCRYVTDKYSLRTLYLIRGNQIVIRFPDFNFIYTLKDGILYGEDRKPAYTQDFSPVKTIDEKEETAHT